MRKVNKTAVKTDLKEAALGVVGGIIANQTSTALEKSSVLGANAKMAPMAVAGLSLLAFIFAPKGSFIKNMAYGALIVSGTEQAEEVTTGLMSGQYTLGFTPQLIPEQFDNSVAQVNGIAVR